MAYLLAAIGAYLLGSIPTGFLVARSRGIDIRKVGSGNMGATNTFRTLGKGPGIFVLLMDVLKGALACFVLAPVIADQLRAGDLGQLKILAGIGAILGHNYTCWLGFKGGKGIATTAGVLLGIMPAALGIVVLVWIVFFLLSRYVSLASMAAALVLPFAAWMTGSSRALILISAILAALAIYKHRSNIRRLLDGTETRAFGNKSPEESTS